MGTKEYRAKKIEYYGRSMGALNFYMHFLLPIFVIYGAVTFIWRATVVSAQFGSTTEFLIDFVLLILSVAALFSVYGVDKYAFFSNTFFLLLLGASQVINTFFPQLLTGAVTNGFDYQSAATTVTQTLSSLSGAMGAFFSGLSEGIPAASSSALQLLAGGGMAAGGTMGGMAAGGSAMAMSSGGAMMGNLQMGMMDGAAQGSTSLVTKLVGLFIKTGEDFTLFSRTVECSIFVLICLFFIFYFIGHRKFFFSSLETFRARDEADS